MSRPYDFTRLPLIWAMESLVRHAEEFTNRTNEITLYNHFYAALDAHEEALLRHTEYTDHARP